MRNLPTMLFSVFVLLALAPGGIASAAMEPIDVTAEQEPAKPAWVTPADSAVAQEAPRAERPRRGRPPRASDVAQEPPAPAEVPPPPPVDGPGATAPPAAPQVPPPPRATPEPVLPRAGLPERIMPLIAERHPELAERLRHLRQRSPEEFRRVLADALAVRLEEAMEGSEADRSPARRAPRGRRGVDRPAGPRPAARMERGPEDLQREMERPRERHEPVEALEREMEALHQHNEELERRSVELAERFRELRQRREPQSENARARIRRAIEETAEEHFNVRTELRRIELRRIEMELDRLADMLGRIRQDLERREQSRGVILERRLHELLGEEGEGW